MTFKTINKILTRRRVSINKLILVFSVFTLFTFTSCEEELDFTGGQRNRDLDSSADKEVVEVDKSLFEHINFDLVGLEEAKTQFEAANYFNAAKLILETLQQDNSNCDVDLINPHISSEGLKIANWALPEGEYRLFIDGYSNEEGIPNSFMTDGKLNFKDYKFTDTEEISRLGRLEWLPKQALAYRVSHNEDYVLNLMKVFEKWYNFNYAKDEKPSEKLEIPQLRVEDAVIRLESMCTAWQYFKQSRVLTPEFAAKFINEIGTTAEFLFSKLDEANVSQAGILQRVGSVFTILKNSSNYIAQSGDILDKVYEPKWFEVLDLNMPALSEVNRAYSKGDLHQAAIAFLEYWKNRNITKNPYVDLKGLEMTTAKQRWADMALEENGFRFYVKNFFENSKEEIPYSYENEEGKINWQYWPTKDQEHRYQLHRHQWMEPQAQVYYLTKDEKYVKNWMFVYNDWIDKNPQADIQLDYSIYPEKQEPKYRNAGWSWRPLDVSARILTQCNLVEYYHNSPSLTPEFLMKYIYFFAVQVNHIKDNYSKTSNHLISQAQAVATAGVLFPEFKDAEMWIDNGAAKLNNEVEVQYYDDGWLMDGDLSYHIGSIENFRSTMIIASINGKADKFPSSYVKAMKGMTEVVANMVYPDYSVPTMGDTRATWTKRVLLRNFVRYSDLFPEDKTLKWLATEGAEGEVPSNLHKYFTDAGYYVMRNGWTEKDQMMVLQSSTQNPRERWHRQWDANTFELYVAGRRFFPDAGCYTYTTGKNRFYFASTKMHNTLTLNDKNVIDCKGKKLKSLTNGNTDILSVENPSYEGLNHRRTVFYVDRKYFVLVDEAYGNAEGEVSLHYHLVPGSEAEVLYDQSNFGAHTNFADNNNIVVRTFSPDDMSYAVQDNSYYSWNIDKAVARKAYKLNITKKAEQKAVRYITVILPTSEPTNAQIKAEFSEDFSEKGISLNVEVNGKKEELKLVL